MPFREALAIADSTLRLRLVDPDDLLRAALASVGHRRPAVLRIAEHADARSANPFESALRGTVVEAGVLGFVPQVVIRTPHSTVRVDLAHREARVVLEADSFAFHGTRAALDQDCRRYDDLVLAGWTVLRFSWEQVMFDEPWVARVVEGVTTARHDPRNGARKARNRGRAVRS